LGLDSEAFNQCMDTGKYTQLVQTQTATGRQIGVQSTPTFAVNGQPVIGAQPFENFQKIFDELLGGS
jgi:protein-disulfide isomerase